MHFVLKIRPRSILNQKGDGVCWPFFGYIRNCQWITSSRGFSQAITVPVSKKQGISPEWRSHQQIPSRSQWEQHAAGDLATASAWRTTWIMLEFLVMTEKTPILTSEILKYFLPSNLHSLDNSFWQADYEIRHFFVRCALLTKVHCSHQAILKNLWRNNQNPFVLLLFTFPRICPPKPF